MDFPLEIARVYECDPLKIVEVTVGGDQYAVKDVRLFCLTSEFSIELVDIDGKFSRVNGFTTLSIAEETL